MKLTSLFEKGVFVITGEVGPIKGAVSLHQIPPRSDAVQVAE